MTQNTPLRVAVVGAGPAGFYAAGHLLKAKDVDVEVDVFDRLPTPWGLVRAGVAPDHPNIKAVSRMYEKTAALPGFRFFGNVELGRDVSREDLVSRYHAVIYSVGTQTDRHMGIPGEELPGSYSATDFVAWYNGHPDYRDLEFALDHERVAVIGNGNVAMDVARMLVLTRDELACTDVADHAIDVLADSGVREVVILGRRGPAQAAFTNPELREMGELTDADVIVAPEEVELDPLSTDWLAEADITHRKNVEILGDYAAREPEGKRKRVIFRFLRSPVEIVGGERVEGLELVRNQIESGGDGALLARPTGETETLPVGAVFRSIGYRGVALPDVPFDEGRGTIPNDGGRVTDGSGEYVAGWIKRGPSGVIGTNKKDAQETVDVLLADHAAGRLPAPADPSPEGVEELLRERAPAHVTYSGWEAIDRAERAAGEPQGRPRVKFCSMDELLEAARDGAAVP